MGMFSNCTSLVEIPELDISKVESLQETFKNCSALTTMPQLDTTNVMWIHDAFKGCISLENITFIENSIKDYTDFSDSSKLTHESLLSIINGLEQVINPRPLTSYYLKLHGDSMSLLSADEIKIATDKGWKVE